MLKNNNLKMLVATTIGSILEIFDFLSFIFLSSIIAKLFFPNNIHGLNIIFTYITISISYLLRPIGGVILGSLGDTLGRKAVFTISILLMSVPSFLISILPTYQQIGYIATILLIIFRILQGFSLGGEVPGSITYIKEKFSDKNYFLATALLTFGANLGVVCAAELVEFLSTHLSSNTMLTFGYRIPFFIGGFLSIVGFYIRKSVTESDAFKKLQETKKISSSPLKTLFKNYKINIIQGILLALNISVITSLFHVILPNLLISYFGYKLSVVIYLSLIGATTMAVFSLFFAYLTRYLSPRFIMTIGCICLIVLFGFLILNNNLIMNHLYIIIFLISWALASINGLFFGILADLFATNVRFSGVALCYNIAYILGAGLTPLWSDLIIKTTYNLQLIFVICLIITTISLININTQNLKNVCSAKKSLPDTKIAVKS